MQLDELLPQNGEHHTEGALVTCTGPLLSSHGVVVIDVVLTAPPVSFRYGHCFNIPTVCMPNGTNGVKPTSIFGRFGE